MNKNGLKIDSTKLRKLANDPARYPKVQLPLEQKVKNAYDVQLDKMMDDIKKVLS